MAKLLLTSIVLLASWLQYHYCMPVTESVSRSIRSIRKYGWPTEALDLMALSYEIPAETYTNEQATSFVTTGLLYLEKGWHEKEPLNKLGSGDQISRSFVYDIDELGALNKPRWRWLPLIDRYDEHGQPVYHISTWRGGIRLTSMDLLRVDYFFSKEMRFLVPTAIVRPIQRGDGFGRGLRFTTVYEYPSSLARYKRQPTLQVAAELHAAIRRDSNRWLASVSQGSRQSVDIYYQLLSAQWLHKNLQAPARRMRQSKQELRTGREPTTEEELSLPASEHHTFGGPSSQDGIPFDRASTPISLEMLFKNWNERTSANANARWHFLASDTPPPSAATSVAPMQTQQYQGLASLAQSSGQALQPGSVEHLHAPMPVRLTRDDLDVSGAWLALDNFDLLASHASTSRSATISADTGHSGFARWRRPEYVSSEHPDPS